MSKAILVLDMPRSCCFCDFCHTKDYDSRYKIDGEKFCCIEDIDVEKYYYAAFQENYIKPDWCPLREIPEKYEVCEEFIYEEMWDAQEKWAFENGWNACLKEIKGE